MSAHLIRKGLALVPERMRRSLRTVPIVGPALRRVSHAVSPPGSRIWVRVERGPARGLELHVDPRFESSIWLGEYEPDVLPRAVALLRPGWTVYDVGAHLGLFTLVAARAVGNEGIVVAFEPDERNRARAREHVERNGLANVVLRPDAVWSEPGDVPFEADVSHPGATQATPSGRPSAGRPTS